jgi:hypothetical protein
MPSVHHAHFLLCGFLLAENGAGLPPRLVFDAPRSAASSSPIASGRSEVRQEFGCRAIGPGVPQPVQNRAPEAIAWPQFAHL